MTEISPLAGAGLLQRHLWQERRLLPGAGGKQTRAGMKEMMGNGAAGGGQHCCSHSAWDNIHDYCTHNIYTTSSGSLRVTLRRLPAIGVSQNMTHKYISKTPPPMDLPLYIQYDQNLNLANFQSPMSNNITSCCERVKFACLKFPLYLDIAEKEHNPYLDSPISTFMSSLKYFCK